jgi:glycosyltransferase involved in cell wall biosynthesis
MAAIFLYPKIDKVIGSPNPYIFNFQKALAKSHHVVNAKSPNRGIISFFTHFFKAELFILNWPETIPEKKFGGVQRKLFMLFLKLAKIYAKKIIWILHNKGSHHKGANPVTKNMFDVLMLHSDYIITHSYAGKDFVSSVYPNNISKVHVIPHPFTEKLGEYRPGKKQFDILIWGSIFPYKGIDVFLDHLRETPELKNLKVLIVGRCTDTKYKRKILSILPENAEFKDELLSLEEIAAYSAQAQFTLFTYKSQTVISSGSLIDSIRMGGIILGPDHGAFKDMKDLAFMHTFKDFNEIPKIISEFNPYDKQIEGDRNTFMNQNTWSNFVEKIGDISGI